MTPVYYVREIEKIMIALLDVFNNLRVKKYSDSASTIVDRTIAVPIYTHYSDDFANWFSTTRTKRETMSVPAAGFRFVTTRPDDEHRTQPMYAREIYSEELGKYIRDITPTPTVFVYELEILTDDFHDFCFLKEQIEPYFNTYMTVRIKEFDFAPDIERPIPFKISWSDQLDDEKSNTSNEYQYFHTKYTIEAHGVMHRQSELPAIIKYAELNFNVDNKIIDSLQVFVYPDAIANAKKQLWETVEPSIREGYSLLKTMTRTLVRRGEQGGEEYWEDKTLQNATLTYHPDGSIVTTKSGNPLAGDNPILKGYKVDADGNYVLDEDGDRIPIYDWEEVVVGDVERPAEVPSFDLLRLHFDEDTSFETDYSGLGRDFVAINDSMREFVPDIAPGNGSYAPGGYAVDVSKTDWSHILDWFGNNKNGTIESPYTFKATLQFTQLGDTVFQYLYNPHDVTLSDGTVIPEGTVWFDWGIMDSCLYFTYHTSSMYKTFRSAKCKFDTNTIYSFFFVLYDNGSHGAFGLKTNFSDTMIALETAEVS